MLGLGTGENLNEHVTGARWPGPIERLEMLREGIDLIRLMFKGGNKTRYGKHYTVQDAQIFTLPEDPPPILVAAANNDAAELAGEMGDGLVSTKPDKEVVEAFHRAGGIGKPKYGQLTVCWARSEAEARILPMRSGRPRLLMGSIRSCRRPTISKKRPRQSTKIR
jgi:coenzyme F420-dependent glucose-6-phosphate dehydrogenase